ncbi:hypothetical protein MRX96_041945 [Rhipicephalus microplus]
MASGPTTAADDMPRLQGVVEDLLLGTDGSAMERERIAAVMRDRVMATPLPMAPHVGAWTVNTGAVPRATDGSAPRLAAAHLPRYSGARDLQSPEEFLERLENFCLVTGVAADKRLTHVVPAALEGGAKLWWRFVRGFDSWEQFTAAFRSEFSSIDAKRRLKAELEQRTQHPEENLKEFIYAIATFYDRIGEEVSEAEKVQRVLRQMHPQLQDLAEGHAYNDLAELVKAADGLMEWAWRRLQYRPPPLPSNQVARDLAFRPSQAPRPSLTAAAEHYGDGVVRVLRVLRLASGWSQSTMSLKCQIEWAAGCRRQQFLCVPDLCRDVVLGRDFLTAVKEQPEAVDDFGDSLRCIFAERIATVCASVPEATAACNVIISGHSSDLDPRMKHILEEFSEIFTTTPGCTTLAEHRIDTGDNPPFRCKLRPVNSKKQAIMDNCIQDLLAQNLIRPSQSQHASAPVLVEKKSGGYRMAVDYRQLMHALRVSLWTTTWAPLRGVDMVTTLVQLSVEGS